jgi:hypothetical protein
MQRIPRAAVPQSKIEYSQVRLFQADFCGCYTFDQHLGFDADILSAAGWRILRRPIIHERRVSTQSRRLIREEQLSGCGGEAVGPRPRAFLIRKRQSAQIGGEDCSETAGLAYPSHPALRRPSSIWAWSSGRCHGTRRRTNMSKAAGAIAMAFASASFASSMRPA